MLKYRIGASITVEASYIMAIVFVSLALLLRFGFQLHDRVVGNAVLNEGIELSGHTEDADTDDLSARGSRRMEHTLSGRGFQIKIEKDGDGYRGTAGGSRYQREIKDKGFHPEKLMRRITLLEAFGEENEY
ncbi:MAG: hypothetical protein Q4C63_08500 [Eubacteriales bacterium]|nr:hypothetical protein [Eubacteriales bacterium]